VLLVIVQHAAAQAQRDTHHSCNQHVLTTAHLCEANTRITDSHEAALQVPRITRSLRCLLAGSHTKFAPLRTPLP
jgi:hypothetical protein